MLEIVSSMFHSLGSTGSETQRGFDKLNIFWTEKVSHLSVRVGTKEEVGQVDISEEDVEAAEAGGAAWEHAEGRDRAAEKAGRTG